MQGGGAGKAGRRRGTGGQCCLRSSPLRPPQPVPPPSSHPPRRSSPRVRPRRRGAPPPFAAVSGCSFALVDAAKVPAGSGDAPNRVQTATWLGRAHQQLPSFGHEQVWLGAPAAESRPASQWWVFSDVRAAEAHEWKMAKLLAYLSTYLGSARISVVAHHVWLVPQFCPRRLGLEMGRGSIREPPAQHFLFILRQEAKPILALAFALAFRCKL